MNKEKDLLNRKIDSLERELKSADIYIECLLKEKEADPEYKRNLDIFMKEHYKGPYDDE